MKVRLELLGPLKLPPEGRTVERDYRPGISVHAVLRDVLAYTPSEMKFLQIMKEGQPLSLRGKINESGTIRVMMRLGGG